MHCEVKCVGITPDEKHVIVGLEDGQIQVISIISNDEEFESAAILKGHKAEVKCICMTSDSETVISGSYDKSIIIWDISERNQRGVLKGSEDKILSLAISKDNTMLVSGSIDNIIRVWDLISYVQKSVIRSIEGNCYAMSITGENKYLVLGCSDNSIRIWSIDDHREEVKLEGHTWPVYSLALTSDGQYLLSTGMDHTVRKWDMTTYKELCILKECNETIYSLAVTSDNLFVVYGKYSGEIGIVSVDGEMKEIAIPCHKACINSVCVSSSSKYIVTGARDGCVQISKLSETPEVQHLEGHSRRVYSLSISSDSQMMASGSDDNSVLVWRLGIEDSECALKGHKGPAHAAVFTHDTRRCISGSQDQNIIVWDLSTEKALSTLRGHEEAVTCLSVSNNDEWLVSGSMDKTVKMWNINKATLECTFHGHSDKVTCLAITQDGFAVSGSKDKTIRVWNMKEKEDAGVMMGHEEEVTSLSVLSNRNFQHTVLNQLSNKNSKIQSNSEKMIAAITMDKLLDKIMVVSSSYDKSVRIWDFAKRELECVLPCRKEVYKACVTSDFLYMFVQTEKKSIQLWSIPDKQELLTLYEDTEIGALALSPDSEWLAYSVRHNVNVVRSPLTKESTFTVLPYSYSFLFKVILHRLLNNDKSQRKTIFSKYVICSHNLSLLHVLTYVSHHKMLKTAIQNGAKFFRTRSGETPLSIALFRKSKVCAEILIKMISKENYIFNPYIFDYLEGLLPVLNKSSLPSLHILYKAAFPLIESSHLPTFGTFIQKPPVLILSDTVNIDPNRFIPIKPGTQHSLTDLEVEFRRSMISLDLSPGSKQCMTFMKSLLKCTNLDIYRTELIRSILKYKWRQIRWFLLLQAYVYCVLLILIVLNTTYDRKNVAILGIAILLNSLFLIYESFQAFSGFGSYFSDIWNLLDASRISILYAYAIMTLAISNQEAEDVLLVLLHMVMWTRLVGYFRIFDGTRYLIHMITQIVTDLGPFLMIFLMCNFGATFTFYADHVGELEFGTWLQSTYLISYASWGFTQKDNLQYVIFFICSLANTLILLNVLIAIISDTYGRVMDIMDIVDMQELADIIIEVDSILFWKRFSTKKQLLISCNIAGSMKKMKAVERDTKSILKLAHEVDQKSKNTEKALERLNQCTLRLVQNQNVSRNEGLIDVILGIKNDFRSFKTEMQAELKQVKHDISSVKTELKGK